MCIRDRAKAIGLVIPELNGKLIGSAQRVPTPTGSTTILTACLLYTSAIGELADGLRIELDKVPKKYAGLDGTAVSYTHLDVYKRQL